MKKIVKFICLVLFLSSCNSDQFSKTESNYGVEVEKYAKENNISAPFLKALISLECSGEIPAGKRFEKGVYEKLKEVQVGSRLRYDGISKNQIKDCSDAAIKNLATSWGPFQIMGYKCIDLGVKIEDLRGDDAIKWGVTWINKEYGGYLRKNAFEQAFRIHNTGEKDGVTYDPNYVENGLGYMQRFGANQSIFVVQDLPEKFTNSHYATKYNLDQHLVIYVDFSKPRTQRRLWVVENGQVIATSFVSHGQKSGFIKPTLFSNEMGSKKSSLGIYSFNHYLHYWKRPKNKGYKFILNGLESSNDNAFVRNVIIHLPPDYNKYVTEKGCFGNSDGCFVVSNEIFELLKSKRSIKNTYLLALN